MKQIRTMSRLITDRKRLQRLMFEGERGAMGHLEVTEKELVMQGIPDWLAALNEKITAGPSSLAGHQVLAIRQQQ